MIGMNWTNRAPQLVAQEAVDRAPVIGVRGVDRRERVPLRRRPRAGASSPRTTWSNEPLPPLFDPVGVVQLARPVDRDADEEVVLLEERRPLLVEQRRVRLDRVRSTLARLEVLVRPARPSGGRSRAPISVGSPPCQAIVTSGTRDMRLDQLLRT